MPSELHSNSVAAMNDDLLGPVAALDCGTNSTRLLIVDRGGRELHREMRVTRLGEGVDASHRLSTEAISRTVSVLADYQKVMQHHGVLRARLVATSAVRDADNGNLFLEAAEDVTGVKPELLPGEQEGRLSFAGATADLRPLHSEIPKGVAGRELVVDIGGGSTELVVGTPGGAVDDVTAISLDVGCVRLTERLFSEDPIAPAALRAARKEVDGLVAQARDLLPTLPPGRVIGLAGTVSTLASLAAGLERYDRERIHHYLLTRDEVEMWTALLAGEDIATRAARPGMVPGRADVIVGGLVVLAAVMEGFERRECLVSESDILDGIVASLL